jgi:hypothetical protein
MTRIAISVLSVASLLTGCSKPDEQKSVSSPAPNTNPPLQLTVTNASPSTPAQLARPNSAAPAPTPAADMIERAYVVPQSGNLFLTFPKTWKDAIVRVQQEKAGYDAVRFLPTRGHDFDMMIDLHHPAPQAYAAMDIKGELTKTGQGELTNSVETSLDIHEFSGKQSSGYYFVVTDKHYNPNQPAKNDFRYLTQGYVKLGGMVIGFRLVGNQLPPVQDQMLEMLKTARLEKKP